MAAAQGNGAKGRASAARVKALRSAEPETATKANVGTATGDTARAKAYRQGQAAARRAMDERPRGRRTRGPAQVHSDPELQDLYAQGHRDTVREARRRTVRERATTGVPGQVVTTTKAGASDGAGFVLGLIGYALVRNYLTGGWSGVGDWFKAKFLNETSAPTSSGPPPLTGTVQPPTSSGQSPGVAGNITGGAGLPGTNGP